MDSIYWLSKPNSGIGNGAGYAHHNAMMYKYTKKYIDVEDPLAEWFLQITPADYFNPVPNKKNCLFTMFEMFQVPDNYKKPLGEADLVLVPCKFSQDLFRPYTKKEPIVVWEGIEPKDFPFYQRKEPDYANGERFRVYWSGAPNPRKGYQYILELIKNADLYPDMEFYIKTTMNIGNPEDTKRNAIEALKNRENLTELQITKLEQIVKGYDGNKFYEYFLNKDTVKVYGKHQNVFFDTRKVPFDELRDLYNKAHVFLFPSQGEGWGLMGTEALSTGCPVIAPMHTGIKEYFDGQIGYPIKFIIEEVKSSNYDLTAGVYVPLYEDMLRQLWNVKNNYQEALARGKRGSKRMREKFTWDMAGQRLASILKKL